MVKEFRQFILRGNLVDLAVDARRCAFCTEDVGPGTTGAAPAPAPA